MVMTQFSFIFYSVSPAPLWLQMYQARGNWVGQMGSGNYNNKVKLGFKTQQDTRSPQQKTK